MQFYRTRIFPHLTQFALSQERFRKLRKEILAELEPPVLEIGFGTGLNIKEMDSRIEEIFVLDPNPGMHRLAQRALKGTSVQVHRVKGASEHLPFPSLYFKSVICTWTLCSLKDPESSLREVRRVLDPEGKLYLLEHGKSPQDSVALWQKRLTPLQKILADGCHLDRDVSTILRKAGFISVQESSFHLPGVPRILGYTTKGIFRKG